MTHMCLNRTLYESFYYMYLALIIVVYIISLVVNFVTHWYDEITRDKHNQQEVDRNKICQLCHLWDKFPTSSYKIRIPSNPLGISTNFLSILLDNSNTNYNLNVETSQHVYSVYVSVSNSRNSKLLQLHIYDYNPKHISSIVLWLLLFGNQVRKHQETI